MFSVVRAFFSAACIMAMAYGVAAAEMDHPWKSVVTLRPARVEGPPIEFDYSFAKAPAPFAKEPAMEGKMIARGLIPTVPPTPLIRNITDRELYLDPNHSGDFTAGPLVTYKSQCRDGVHVVFNGLRVLTERGSLLIPYDVYVRTYQRGYAGRLFVLNGWSGTFERGGKTWRMTIIDNLDGQIDDQDRLHLDDGEPASATVHHDCPVPQVLFLDGCSYRLDIAFRSAEQKVVLEATWTEIQLPMGELRIEADGCQSLVLRDDLRMVPLSNPGGAISVPVGNYRVEACVVRSQEIAPVFAGCAQTTSVRPEATALLRLGPPLSNTMVVTRDRNLLGFKYQLVGAGGELYDYDNVAYPPGFRIYKGPVKIGQGCFGFG